MASWLNLIGKGNRMKLKKKVEHIDYPLYEPLEKLLTNHEIRELKIPWIILKGMLDHICLICH
jgi:hypothetical protein